MRIAVFHLNNDYSGAPKALLPILEGLLDKGVTIDLVTSAGGPLDVLAQREGCRVIHCSYNYSQNKLRTSLSFLMCQLRVFFKALGMRRGYDAFYINTILPVGAALAGRLTGKRLVYHYHENAYRKGRVYRALADYMQRVASRIICVSDFQKSFLKRVADVSVVPNVVPEKFLGELKPDPEAKWEKKNVLMFSLLKPHKGTIAFTEIARRLPQYRFTLVINDTRENIDSYWQSNGLPVLENLTVLPTQRDVAECYNEASLVLNLSIRRLHTETFGLTALEAFHAGVPVIAPDEGGIPEVVTHDVSGYLVKESDIEGNCMLIDRILSDKELYMRLSHGASENAKRFDHRQAVDTIYKLLKP